jgi:hypothetical protein
MVERRWPNMKLKLAPLAKRPHVSKRCDWRRKPRRATSRGRPSWPSGSRRAAANNIWSGHDMMFTSEFFRIRERDNAHATLGRITHIAPDLESAKVKAKTLFDTLNLPKNPDGLRISDQDGQEMFF